MSKPNNPENRLERYLDVISGSENELPENPENRLERYLDVIAGGDGEKPENPENRLERYLDVIADNPGDANPIIIEDPEAEPPESELYKFAMTESGSMYLAVSKEQKNLWYAKKVSPLQQISPTRLLTRIVYGNNKYLAVGEAGYISWSNDGVSWSVPEKLNTTGSLCAAAYGAGVWVCGGTSGKIFYSTNDGVTWNEGGSAGNVRSICYGNGLFVAVGSSSGNFSYSYYSADGITWTQATITGYNAYTFTKVAYGNDGTNSCFIAARGGNNLYYSFDGVHWKTYLSNYSYTDICYGTSRFGRGYFVAVGDNGHVASVPIDMITESIFSLREYDPLMDEDIDAVAFIETFGEGYGGWVCVGEKGTSFEINPDGGDEFPFIGLAPDLNYVTIAGGNSRWVCATSKKIAYTTGGGDKDYYYPLRIDSY